MDSLILLAALIGFTHTLLGPDHYLPFIALSKANNWSVKKTTFITFICGFIHVLSSIVIGLLGIWFGVKIVRLEIIESFRGELASWLLISFGLVYLIWAVRNLAKEKTGNKQDKNMNWALFVIFILGPCEPLIPILMFPALTESLMLMASVVIVFSLVTITTMVGVVLSVSYGLNLFPLKSFRYSHILAGSIICFCGLAVKFLGI